MSSRRSASSPSPRASHRCAPLTFSLPNEIAACGTLLGRSIARRRPSSTSRARSMRITRNGRDWSWTAPRPIASTSAGVPPSGKAASGPSSATSALSIPHAASAASSGPTARTAMPPGHSSVALEPSVPRYSMRARSACGPPGASRRTKRIPVSGAAGAMSMVTRRWPPAAGPQYATGSRNVRWAERGYLTCIVFADLVFEWRNDAFFCARCPCRGAPKTCPRGLCARWKLLTQSREPRLRDRRRRPRRHVLERLDLHLAPLDRAAGSVVRDVAELKSERPLRESAVLDVDRLDPVQHHDQLAALGGDLVGVPPSAGLGHRRYLGEIDDRPRAVGRVGALVVDIHFVGALRSDLGRIGRADEDPAVRVVIRPELGPDHEILVGVLRDEVAALALVGDDRAPFGSPVGVADPVPVLEARAAVDQRHPPRVPSGHVGAPESAEHDDQQPDGDAR